MAEKGTQELRFLFVVMLVSQRAAAAAAAYPPTPRRENDDCTKSPQSMLATIHIAQHKCIPDNSSSSSNVAVDPRSP